MIQGAIKGALLALTMGALSGVQAAESDANDYPTNARADYVFGCMAANGRLARDAQPLLVLDRRHRFDPAL